MIAHQADGRRVAGKNAATASWPTHLTRHLNALDLDPETATGKPFTSLTPDERDRKRKANREHAARKRAAQKDQVNAVHRKNWTRRKNRRNEERRAKYDRDWTREKRTHLRQVLNVFGDRIDTASLVTGRAIREDLTRWRGPGGRKSRALEAQADKILNPPRKKPSPPEKTPTPDQPKTNAPGKNANA